MKEIVGHARVYTVRFGGVARGSTPWPNHVCGILAYVFGTNHFLDVVQIRRFLHLIHKRLHMNHRFLSENHFPELFGVEAASSDSDIVTVYSSCTAIRPVPIIFGRKVPYEIEYMNLLLNPLGVTDINKVNEKSISLFNSHSACVDTPLYELLLHRL